MNIKKSEYRVCPCCMEEHEVYTVNVREWNVFKEKEVEYEAVYEYCDKTEEYFATGEMVSDNDIAMKNAYRINNNLLTTTEIEAIRNKYSISQKDFARLLGWGEKTITRYEGHQVQDMAHDTVIRKIGEDPAWFMELLENGRSRISEKAYKKYMAETSKVYEIMQDQYLRQSISARYIKYQNDSGACGNTKLNFDKIVDAVNYFADAANVYNLFKVKLMKLLWYADALSYKRYGHSITGMVYFAKPMGALALAHKQIIELKGISYEEIDFDNGSGLKFLANNERKFDSLSGEDIDVLNTVISKFGSVSKDELVDNMHEEDAYRNTPENEVIDFKYAENLSIA